MAVSACGALSKVASRAPRSKVLEEIDTPRLNDCLCSLFVLDVFGVGSAAMDIAKEQEIIRLWNRYRLLQREGRAADAILRQLEKAMAERERAA
jgi:hypothetical protein